MIKLVDVERPVASGVSIEDGGAHSTGIVSWARDLRYVVSHF